MIASGRDRTVKACCLDTRKIEPILASLTLRFIDLIDDGKNVSPRWQTWQQH